MKKLKFRIDKFGNTNICIPKNLQEEGDRETYWDVERRGACFILASGTEPLTIKDFREVE